MKKMILSVILAITLSSTAFANCYEGKTSYKDITGCTFGDVKEVTKELDKVNLAMDDRYRAQTSGWPYHTHFTTDKDSQFIELREQTCSALEKTLNVNKIDCTVIHTVNRITFLKEAWLDEEVQHSFNKLKKDISDYIDQNPEMYPTEASRNPIAQMDEYNHEQVYCFDNRPKLSEVRFCSLEDKKVSDRRLANSLIEYQKKLGSDFNKYKTEIMRESSKNIQFAEAECLYKLRDANEKTNALNLNTCLTINNILRKKFVDEVIL